MSNDTVSNILEILATIKRDCLHYYNAKVELEQQLSIIKDELNRRNDHIKSYQKEVEDMQKLVSEQQFTISKLIEIKNDFYNQKNCLKERDKTIEELLKEIDVLNVQHEEDIKKTENECNLKVKQSKNEILAAISNNALNAKGLQEEIQKLGAEKDDQLTAIIMEYEEKMQRMEAQITLIKDELQNNREHSNTTIAVYQEKLREMELKLKTQANKPNFASVAPMIFKSVTSKEKPKNSNTHKSNSKFNKNFSPLKVTIAPINVSENSDFQEKKPTKRKLFSKFNEEFVNMDTFEGDDETN